MEMARHTRRGDFQVQFLQDHLSRATDTFHDCDIPLDQFGIWRLSRNSSRFPLDSLSVVISRVSSSMSSDDFVDDFVCSNASRFSDFDADSLRIALHSATRLPRREIDSSGNTTWVPSLSLKCVVARKLGEALLASGSVVVGFRSTAVRPFHPPIRYCFHCGREGHLARYYRSPARCARCGDGHPLRDCPHRPSSRPREPMPHSVNDRLAGAALAAACH